MAPLPVSVIVVSRGRAGLLARCLTGLGQMYYPAFEIVVVADEGGIAAVAEMGWQARVKTVPFDAPNISAARNAGIAAAAGEIVAFIDDDAVPEPTWLDHLAAPFADPVVVAAGGYVRGRNGISFQYRAGLVSRTGEEVPLEVAGEAPRIVAPPPGHAVKTMGTNCAFRRQDVSLMGGLDPVFRFFHDETDLNMRLAGAGGKTAVVPLAQVHHGYAASDRRASDRAPRSLREIGASSMVFLRKHAPEQDWPGALERLRAEQRRRLLAHMVRGGLEPRDVARLLEGLEAGIAEGRQRVLAPLSPLTGEGEAFLPFTPAPRGHVCIAGRTWSRRHLRARALGAVRAGKNATVFRFSPTALYHDVRFVRDGYWLHRGGLFGRAERSEPVFRLVPFRRRVAQEWARVAKLRQKADFSPRQMTAGNVRSNIKGNERITPESGV